MSDSHCSTKTCGHCGGICLKCGMPVDNDGVEFGCCHHCRSCRDDKRTLRLDITPRYCMDCGAELFRVSGRGRWPVRCASCNATAYGLVARDPLDARECEWCGFEFTPRIDAQRFCCRDHKTRAMRHRNYSPEKRRADYQRRERSCPLIVWVENKRKREYMKTEAGRLSTERYRQKVSSLPADHPVVVKQRERRRTAWYKREALKRGSDGSHTDAQVVEQAERQRHRCYWCGKRIGQVIHTDYHPDHVMPLSLGGSNDASNIVASCPRCNLSKSGKHPMDWAGVLC